MSRFAWVGENERPLGMHAETSHALGLGEGWRVWRVVCLRAPGFSANNVLRVASGPLASAADRLLLHENLVGDLRDGLLAQCRSACAALGLDERRALRRALRLLSNQRIPGPLMDPAHEAARVSLEVASDQLKAVQRDYLNSHEVARREVSSVLREIIADERFRLAVLWQSPAALRDGVDALARQPLEASDRKTREKERLVASYLQRYSVKNDSIGFFGPIGWARWVEDKIHLTQQPGSELLSTREVYFEHWAIDRLALGISQDPLIKPFIAPRRLPRARLEGQTLCHSDGRRTELPPDLSAAFSHCDGIRTARDIATILMKNEYPSFENEEAVFAVLEELAEANLILWNIEVPTATIYPERALVAALRKVEAPEAREAAEKALTSLLRGRERVASSRTVVELDTALAELESCFTEQTGEASRRLHGKTYAGRTLVYEDCRRAGEVLLGSALLERLSAPLTLVLQSARWFTYEIATRYRTRLSALFAQKITSQAQSIPLGAIWKDIMALFPGPEVPHSVVGEVRDELRRRWAEVLQVDPSERTVHRTAAGLTSNVEQMFAAPGPGWPLARHHSPDILIAAVGDDALQKGNYQIVFGELHTGLNTVVSPVLAKTYPDTAALISSQEADVGHVCVAPVWSKAITRGDYYSLSPKDWDLETGQSLSARTRDQVLALGALWLEEREGKLEVRTEDGSQRFDIIAFLERYLIAESVGAFSVMPPTPYSPRVTVDQVVIARATWRFDTDGLEWVTRPDAAERFVGARRWARVLGLPRWVFVKTPVEIKPLYVDFDSPLFVDVLAKQLRAAPHASVSEMLPSVSESWLLDSQGSQYTAELRMVTVDPRPWHAP